MSGTGQRDVGFERQSERLLVMKEANKSRDDSYCVGEPRRADRDQSKWASLGACLARGFIRGLGYTVRQVALIIYVTPMAPIIQG